MKTLSILLAVALMAVTAPTAGAIPDNYCTTVTVTVVASGYDVTAVGAGRYARVRDLTAGATVVATDFGAGATLYTWTALALDTSHEYQVQVSHTSLTTGYSTSGCIFTPPVSLGVILGAFTATAQGSDVLLAWETMSEWDNLGFDVYRNTTPDWATARQIAHVPSTIPGGTFGQQYEYLDAGLAPASYWYWLKDVNIAHLGLVHGPVSATVLATPSAVTLSAFSAGGSLTCQTRTLNTGKRVCWCKTTRPGSRWQTYPLPVCLYVNR